MNYPRKTTLAIGRVSKHIKAIYLRDYAVEGAASVPEAVLTRSQLTEVFRGLRNYIIIELEYNPTSGLLVDGDVKLERTSL
jgi:hypothetical protein